MEIDDLPDPADLWWSWVFLAALHRAGHDAACGYDERHGVLHLDAADGSWLRLQRVLRTRSVLWGRSTQVPPAPPDARHGAPDWAVTDATLARRPSFMAWHAHGEWDHSSPAEDTGVVHLLRPILGVDPHAAAVVRAGTTDAAALAPWIDGPHLDEAVALVRAAAAGSPTRRLGAVRTRLRDQIHEQMRESPERDRMLIQRPPSLVHWARVNGPDVPFEYAVMALRGRMTTSAYNTRLPRATVHTLDNVLAALHHEEASTESGAWLFARVTFDGTLVSFDRAFDSWPEWYRVVNAGEGPGLEDLAWEMAQRSAPWRPTWSRLLPG
ncbi:MAG TPA: hypothetical protein VFJ28_04750 [Marmoricola sp.]|nr:hypothetical protein [Marmoricola sp.]